MRFFSLLSRLTLVFLIGQCVRVGATGQKHSAPARSNPPIYIAFLWHMHQPIYWPYESIVQTDQLGRYPYFVKDIHNQRTGPYTTWPANAVQKGITAGFPHFGAQVSFSGSLIENLNNLEANGNANFQNWKSSWNALKTQTTSLGNPRLDMVGFGYHHPLMGLIDTTDIRRQIGLHRQTMGSNFSGSYSRGIFPPENAFSPRMIPALVREGLQWVLVDNIHFDRTCNGYPFSTAGNLYEPNKADVRNTDPADWVQLNGLWAPTQNSARWGRQPHYVEYINPDNGTSSRMIAVPTDRYLGNEDGRGGFGALSYDSVMSQLEPYNSDPNHPILIVLHHDGDNYGGGTDSYYNANFQSFVNWLLANPSRFVCTTVQDYLDQFPPGTTDVMHVEDGSWSGADNGDPEFKKWNGDPVAGYSPDRNSWSVLTAAKNIVATAQQVNALHPNMPDAWKYLLNAEASDYWYWDGSQNGIWDSHPARASNQAIQFAQPVAASGTDLTPPTIYLPQREPYNPGATEWGINQSNTMTVWTYAYDISGLRSVTLRYRTDLDGANPKSSIQNETYAGGNEVSGWTDVPMSGTIIASQTNPMPLVKAREYSASVSGLTNVLLDYYVEAIDSNSIVGRSPILHVWIGPNTTGGGTGTVVWVPTAPTKKDSIRITVRNASQGAKLHWGVNNNGSSWQTPSGVYRPAGSTLFNGTGPAVETPMVGPDTAGNLIIQLGPFNNAIQSVDRLAFVIHYNNDTWDNNSGQDYHITIGGSSQPQAFIMDGVIDTSARVLTSANGLTLYLGWNGVDLYVATTSAPSQGGDLFIMVADSPKASGPAPWAKAGTVAGWSAFLGNESTNNFAGWYNSGGTSLAGSVLSAAGSALEGTINLQSLFGTAPPVIYVVLARYQTQDGGTLLAQAPPGNGNGNIEANEYLAYDYTALLTVPPIPLPASPADNAVNQPTSLILRWHAASGAISYRLQLGTDSTFGSGVALDDSTIVDTVLSVSSLEHAKEYFWRVNGGNSKGRSEFSLVRKFTTAIAPPPAPYLLAPPDQSDSLEGIITLSWSRAATATAYHLRVSPDSTFAVIVIDDSSLVDTTILFDTFAGQYFWKIRAGNAGGFGPFSPAWRFRGLEYLPAVPALVSPSDNAVDQPPSVIVLWDSSAHARLYDLQLAKDSLFSLLVANDSLLTARFRQVGALIKMQEYFWRVRSRNTRGTSNWSGTRRFTVSNDSAFVYALHGRWNLVSIPFVTSDTRGTVLFPTGYSPAYAYEASGYVPKDTLAPSRGYWMKFPSDQSNTISGRPLTSDTIAVHQGWNLIGTIADTVDPGAIVQEPPGIVNSMFYTFEGSYQSNALLIPGRGYWIKAAGDGMLILRPAGVREVQFNHYRKK